VWSVCVRVRDSVCVCLCVFDKRRASEVVGQHSKLQVEIAAGNMPDPT
jgi:hypothetical protein